MINLDMNENRHIKEIIMPNNDYQRIYPRKNGHDLVKLLSTIHEIDYNDIYLVNGIDEGIWHFLKYVQQKHLELYIDTPNYCGVLDGIRALNIQAIINSHADCYNADSTIQFLQENSGIIKAAYLCSPINPLGICISRLKDIIDICEKNDILVFLDQAYIEFCNSDITFKDIYNYNNLILARTFSKAYGLAGIRCGYIATRNPYFANVLNESRIIQQYHLSSYSIQCAIRALYDHNRLQEALSQIEHEKQKLYLFLESLKLRYIQTKTNFVLIYLESFSKEFLQFANDNGVVLTSTEDFGLPNYVRISIGNADDMKKLKWIILEYWRKRHHNDL